MRVLAVPVKPLSLAKRRLSPVLSQAERAALALAMAETVVEACRDQRGWATWVVSRDDAVLSRARDWGVTAFEEPGTTLSSAVDAAASEVGEDDLAVVLADLPLATATALAPVLSIEAPVVAVRAASDGGTNVLVRRPSGAIRARFGRSSYQKHAWAARRARVPFEEALSAEMAFDLDTPDDLSRLVNSGKECRAREMCVAMGIPDRLRAGA